MRPTRHTLRNDDRYTVVVGWDYDLESFYVDVRDRLNGAEPVVDMGRTPHELPTISSLLGAVSRFAPVRPELVSALRHDARPLGDIASLAAHEATEAP